MYFQHVSSWGESISNGKSLENVPGLLLRKVAITVLHFINKFNIDFWKANVSVYGINELRTEVDNS